MLCDIRLIAISSNQDSGVSFCSSRNFEPCRKFATRRIKTATHGSEEGIWPLK